MADKWNNSDRDADEQAIGTEEFRGVGSEDEEFEETDDLDDEEDEDGPAL